MAGTPRVVVVGGGISGLAAAVAVRSHLADAEITVLEGSPDVGGKLRLAEVAGCPIDVGAEALLARRPEGVQLIEALGLSGDLIEPITTSASLRVGGALHALPTRTVMGIPADVEAVRASGALTAAGVAAVAAEPGMAPLPPLDDDISVGSLVRARLGDEVADRLVEPLLGGVYAGRADDLSLRATVPALAAKLESGGSLVEAAQAVTPTGTYSAPAGPLFVSLSGGLGRLPQRVATAGLFTLRTSTTVRSVRRTATGFALECGPVPETELIEADAVILAVPPAKAARLLEIVAPSASAELAEVETASMAIVTFAYRGIDLPPGSGILVGAGERLAVKATTLSSQKWPLQTGDLTFLRASVGRVGETHVLQRDDDELIALVRSDLRAIIGVDAEPVDAIVTRWGGGLPQYAVGHVEKVARIRASVAKVPGLAVCGAVYDGVGIPACIASAYAAAGQVLAALEQRGH
jgi:protoporphyrinogen/coproporphyrinogen III oxidase